MSNNADKVKYLKETLGIETKKCMRCGKCTATCPNFELMEFHPHQFVALVESGRIDKLLSSNAAFMCFSCFACLERCPRLVEPARLIEGVRLLVAREQGADFMSPDEIPALLDEDLPQQALVSAFRKYKK